MVELVARSAGLSWDLSPIMHSMVHPMGAVSRSRKIWEANEEIAVLCGRSFSGKPNTSCSLQTTREGYLRWNRLRYSICEEAVGAGMGNHSRIEQVR